MQVRAGTQCIDGFWAHLRAHIDKAHRSTPDLVAEFVRPCQFCSSTLASMSGWGPDVHSSMEEISGVCP